MSISIGPDRISISIKLSPGWLLGGVAGAAISVRMGGKVMTNVVGGC